MLTQRYATLTLDPIAGARVAPSRDFNFSRINLANALMAQEASVQAQFRTPQDFINRASGCDECALHRAFVTQAAMTCATAQP